MPNPTKQSITTYATDQIAPRIASLLIERIAGSQAAEQNEKQAQ